MGIVLCHLWMLILFMLQKLLGMVRYIQQIGLQKTQVWMTKNGKILKKEPQNVLF